MLLCAVGIEMVVGEGVGMRSLSLRVCDIDTIDTNALGTVSDTSFVPCKGP